MHIWLILERKASCWWKRGNVGMETTTDMTQMLASFLEWRRPARGCDRGRGHGGMWTTARAGLGKVHEQINRDEPVYPTNSCSH